MDATAKWLVKTAEEEVRNTLQSLPADLARMAAGVAVIHEPVPGQGLLDEGWEEDLLGMFSGNPWAEPLDQQVPMPPQIVLFYDNLWEMAEGNEEVYRAEVRITYLHELGHYLGLDEDDLEDRGLL